MPDPQTTPDLQSLRETLEKAAVTAWGSQIIDFQEQLIKIGDHCLKLAERVAKLEGRICLTKRQ